MIELMIVVAITGILAAIAIPNFLRYQARSRRSEAFVNLSAVARTEKAFQATRGVFHDSNAPFPNYVPYGGLGTHKMNWDGPSENAFGELGWKPEGEVYYSYETNTSDGCTCDLCFTATAYGDVDNDGNPSAVMYVEPERNSAGGIVGSCPALLFGFGTPTTLGGGAPIYNQVAVQRTTDEF